MNVGLSGKFASDENGEFNGAIIRNCAQLMATFGIAAVESKSVSAGLCSVRTSVATPMAKAPREMRNYIVAAKDAIVKILSIAGVEELRVNISDDEQDVMARMWLEAADAVIGTKGSAQ